MKRFRGGIPDLAAIRSSRGIPLEKIAASTKIGLFYLRAIEKGDIRKLPGGVYARSYIRQYARAIDYDEYELLERAGLGRREERDAKDEPGAGNTAGRLAQWITPLFHGRTADSNRTG